MAKMRWEEILADRGPQAPSAPVPRQIERSRVPGEQLGPQERRALMLQKAEEMGITVEAEAMLNLVRAVEGFTNMAKVYKIPDRGMIDAERMKMRGGTDAQARGRAWKRLHDRQALLDREMQESGTGYARPSDWFRLFAALKKATKPGQNVPNVFAAESPKDRSAFRAWAEQYGLDGDGLVHVAKMIRDEQEAKTRASFNVGTFIEKIQALSAEQLHKVIRAGFEADDIFVRSDEGNCIPLKQLPARYAESQARERLEAIRAEIDRMVNAAPPLGNAQDARDFRSQTSWVVAGTYDAQHFYASIPDRSSVGFDGGIVSNVFATVRVDGRGERVGYGYHGIIEPELLEALPTGYLLEERGKPRVRSFDGKTVVDVQRWLINKNGIGLMPAEEPVQGNRAAVVEQAAARTIANAIVYKIRERPRSSVGYREDIFEPHYWNDVHWIYKKLVENRLPLLAKIAGVNPGPLHTYTGADAESEWMFDRIVSSGVSTAKQLDDKRSHFVLTLDDVFSAESDRAALREAEKQYPETILLGKHPFTVKYEWDPKGEKIVKGVVDVERGGGAFANAHWLERATPADVPLLGTRDNPVLIMFRFEDVSFGIRQTAREFSANRFGELLEIIQPKERFLAQAWRDFSTQDPVGKMDIPLTITPNDQFPTPALLDILMESRPRTIWYVVDRDGVEHFAHATIRYSDGDTYRIQYAQNTADAEASMARAKEKYAQRVVALRAREAMGDGALSETLKNVRALQVEADAMNAEFEADNLVAFVLGEPPFSESDQRSVQSCLDENDIPHAEMVLRNRIHDRQDTQAAIDAMRKVSATITELEALGFDWRRFDYNARSRDDDSRPDREGFYPSDIRLRKHEVYRPSMGRIVGRRADRWGLQRRLSELQLKLDRELELLKLKRAALRDGRQQKWGLNDTAAVEPEVFCRGSFEDDGDDDF
ncbi:MAG: hypothetical protein AAB473_02785 [Patescibacteria group bacterium]